jgi:hypothetical protein
MPSDDMPSDDIPAVRVRRLASTRPGTVAGAVWAVVYLVVCLTGQRFSTAYLDYGWQIIPWDTLSSDPLRSVWYLHVQPPLWNLTLGGLAWLSPASDAITLQLLMAGFGVLAAVWATALARELGVPPGVAITVGLVATLHPEVLKNAFEPTYELPTAALLLGVVLAAVRWGRDGRSLRWAAVLVGLTTAVVLTRSLYHPLWLVAVVAFCWWVARGGGTFPTRRVLALALVPLVLIGGWMVKNEALFDRATLSSWFGMNLQRAVIPVLDADELQAMFDAGEVSDIAMIGPFGDFDLYAPFEPAASCLLQHGHPAVAVPDRTTDFYSPNFNYECYLPVFDQAGDDAMAVIRAHPGVWWEGRLWSARVYFAVSPTAASSESRVLQGLDAVYSLVRVDLSGAISTLGWGTPIFGSLEAPADFGLLQVAAYVAAVAIGGVHLVRLLRRRRSLSSFERGRSLGLTVSGFTVLWTFGVGVVAELGEQARFRTMTDALVWVTVLSVVLLRVTGTDAARDVRAGDDSPVQEAQASAVGR